MKKGKPKIFTPEMFMTTLKAAMLIKAPPERVHKPKDESKINIANTID